MSITTIIHKQLVKMDVPLEIDEVQDVLVVLGIDTKDQQFIQVRRMEFNDSQSTTQIDHTISSGINKYIKDNHDITKIGVLFVLRMFGGMSLNNIQHNILTKIKAKFPAKFAKVAKISEIRTGLMNYLSHFDDEEHLLVHYTEKFKLQKVTVTYVDCDILDSSDDISIKSDEDDEDYDPKLDYEIEKEEEEKEKAKEKAAKLDSDSDNDNDSDSDDDIDVTEFITESKKNILKGTRKRKETKFFVGDETNKKTRTSPTAPEVDRGELPENVRKLFNKTHSKRWHTSSNKKST
jgi:hypothetical protein